MNTSTYIAQQARQTERVANMAIERVRRATSIRELVEAMHVPLRPEMRPLKRLCPSLRRLKYEAARSARRIGDRQLTELAAITCTTSFLSARGPFMADWRYLNGTLPEVARYVQEESSRLWNECFKHAYQPTTPAALPAVTKD